MRPTGDRQAPPVSFRVFSDFAGSGFERGKKYFYRGNEVKKIYLDGSAVRRCNVSKVLGRSCRGPFLLFPPTRRP